MRASNLYGMARKLIGEIIAQKSPGPATGPPPACGSVTRFKTLLGRNLVVADVGCRWGFAEFLQQLSPHIVLYGFDPDPVECERLRTLYKDPNIHLVPLGLTDVPGERTLYMTREMACSSLYRPDPSLTSSLPELACASEVGRSKIPVTTLDNWSVSAGIFSVDFLKLDTQGAELDILHGGERLLASVSALEVEVDFNPIYLHQPLFGDVDRFLRDRGFVPWKLSTLAHYSRAEVSGEPEEKNTTYYDTQVVTHPVLSGQLYWGHAYYVRKEIASGTPRDWQQSLRGPLLMEVLGFNALAKQLLIDALRDGGPAELRGGFAND
jgi:FkbM family methyltransferase